MYFHRHSKVKHIKAYQTFRPVPLSYEKPLLASSCMPVHVSLSISSATTGRIFVKLGTGDFYERMSKKS